MVEGARATLKFAQISLYTHSPSVSRSRASSLPEGAFYRFTAQRHRGMRQKRLLHNGRGSSRTAGALPKGEPMISSSCRSIKFEPNNNARPRTNRLGGAVYLLTDLKKSLSPRERWRADARRRGKNARKPPLTRSAGALPKGEPMISSP